jgi:hypothetical protein
MTRGLFAGIAASLILSAVAALPASAEVVSRTADGFVLRYETTLETTSDDAWVAFGDIGRWWNGAHTYSGSGANLTLPLEVGACFCEALADGASFEHGRVTVADPGTGVLLDAPLGPLKGKATKAQWSIGWTGANRGLSLIMTYVVQGPGLGALAGPVDGVMGDQFARYAHYVEYGESPDTPETSETP